MEYEYVDMERVRKNMRISLYLIMTFFAVVTGIAYYHDLPASNESVRKAAIECELVKEKIVSQKKPMSVQELSNVMDDCEVLKKSLDQKKEVENL